MIQWTKLEQSYKALQTYARQNGTTAMSFKHWSAKQTALRIYKNKLACAREHSNHINQVPN